MRNYLKAKKSGRCRPLCGVTKKLVQALFFAGVVAPVLAVVAGHLVGAVKAG
jgi:hypothetical protein